MTLCTLKCVKWCIDTVLWWDSQSLSVSINEGLEERFVMGDGLQDVPVSCHVADRPLAQPSAAQPENVAARETMETFNFIINLFIIIKNILTLSGVNFYYLFFLICSLFWFHP